MAARKTAIFPSTKVWLALPKLPALEDLVRATASAVKFSLLLTLVVNYPLALTAAPALFPQLPTE